MMKCVSCDDEIIRKYIVLKTVYGKTSVWEENLCNECANNAVKSNKDYQVTNIIFWYQIVPLTKTEFKAKKDKLCGTCTAYDDATPLICREDEHVEELIQSCYEECNYYMERETDG